MSNCVYCNTSSNLNTELTITLEDGNKVTVAICDEHAEEASIKTAKAAYLEKQTEIQKVIEQARALGLNISETAGGLAIAQAAPAPEPPPQLPAEVEQAQPEPTQQVRRTPRKNGDNLEEDPDVVSTDRLDSHRGMHSVGGGTDFGSVESLSSHDMDGFKEKLPDQARKGVAKMGIAEGREGQPIIIPRVRKDGTGTTRVNIVKTDDRVLQESFKKMAKDSMEDRVPDFARSGYSNSTRDCPICRGECEVNGETCPKCKGQGIISVY